ncbi:MAG: histidine kinase dimerization/phospho-acceptor domain-containing protein, partial [bacterium]|nr:histidine kinase dimerization/phospho-acceptor domain-containing protein [bacterium]
LTEYSFWEKLRTYCCPANKKLEQMDRERSELIRHLSHEAQTSLTSIKWAATLLPEKIKDNAEEDVQKLVDIIIEENERLIHLLGKSQNTEHRTQSIEQKPR